MNKFRYIEPIVNNESSLRHALCIDDIVDDNAQIHNKWIDAHNWNAVPIESAGHFDENDASNLSKAMLSVQCTTCYAIATESLGDVPHCYKIETTQKGLMEFSHICSPFNFILVPENIAFAVLCTVFDYFIVAGPVEFVESAIGKNINDAKEDFKLFANNWDNDFHRGRLLSVLDRYNQQH